MAHIVGEFDDLKLRTVSEAEDRKRLDEWIRADLYHNGIVTPDFFLGRIYNADGDLVLDPRPSCYALDDEKGTVFYVRLSRASRVNIQFAPQPVVAHQAQRDRVANSLIKGMAYLETALARAGAEEWIFETRSLPLRNLAMRQLGFRQSRNELVREIEYVEEVR